VGVSFAAAGIDGVAGIHYTPEVGVRRQSDLRGGCPVRRFSPKIGGLGAAPAKDGRKRVAVARPSPARSDERRLAPPLIAARKRQGDSTRYTDAVPLPELRILRGDAGEVHQRARVV